MSIAAVERPTIDELLAEFCTARADYDPTELYGRLRDVEPVYRSQFGFWIISRHADASYLLKGGQTARTAPVGARRLTDRAAESLLPHQTSAA